MIKIRLVSVFVNNQDQALHFFTKVLGIEKKVEIPLGDASWLTVVSPKIPKEPSCFWSRITIPPPKPTRKPFIRTEFQPSPFS